VKNMSLFNSHVPNMMFFTCCQCFNMIWNTMSPSFSRSITKSLINCYKWATNTYISLIFNSPCTCIPSWLTWSHWIKHNFDTCLNKYNVLMVNSTLHLFFIEPPHYTLVANLWWITFPLMSNVFGGALWFCLISLTTFVISLGSYWHWYLQTTMWTNFNATYEHELHYKTKTNHMFIE